MAHIPAKYENGKRLFSLMTLSGLMSEYIGNGGDVMDIAAAVLLIIILVLINEIIKNIKKK